MKRIIKALSFIIALSFVLALASCDNDKNTPETTAAHSTETALPSSSTETEAAGDETAAPTENVKVDLSVVTGERYEYHGISVFIPTGFSAENGTDENVFISSDAKPENNVLLSVSDYAITDFSVEDEKEIWDDIYGPTEDFGITKGKAEGIEYILISAKYKSDGKDVQAEEWIFFMPDGSVSVDFNTVEKSGDIFTAMAAMRSNLSINGVTVPAPTEPLEMPSTPIYYHGVRVSVPEDYDIKHEDNDSYTIIPNTRNALDFALIASSNLEIDDLDEGAIRDAYEHSWGELKNLSLTKSKMQDTDCALYSFEFDSSGDSIIFTDFVIFMSDVTVHVSFYDFTGIFTDDFDFMLKSVKIIR